MRVFVATNHHSRAKGGFSRLLSDVTNSLKIEQDEKVAVKIQDADANSLINEWVQEVKGSIIILLITSCVLFF